MSKLRFKAAVKHVLLRFWKRPASTSPYPFSVIKYAWFKIAVFKIMINLIWLLICFQFLLFKFISNFRSTFAKLKRCNGLKLQQDNILKADICGSQTCINNLVSCKRMDLYYNIITFLWHLIYRLVWESSFKYILKSNILMAL